MSKGTPGPVVAPPAVLRWLSERGFDPKEAAIVAAYQLFHFPATYLAEVFGVSAWTVRRVLDRAAALGLERVPREELMKRPHPGAVDPAERQRLLERFRRLEDPVGLKKGLDGLGLDGLELDGL